MYAVIESGGKQYRVQPGDFIAIEKLTGEVGSSVKFSQVLLLSKPGTAPEQASQVWVGKPYVSSATVEGEIVGQGRGEKTLIIKMKRRKGYRKTQGHRQFLTQVLVTSLSNGSGEAAELSAEDKKKKLSSFVTSLTPKGGSPRVNASSTESRAAQSKSSAAPSEKKAAPRKAPAKKAKKAE